MFTEVKDDRLIIHLQGRIDSTNAQETERLIMDAIGENEGKIPSFDMSELDYISSAGLRVLMKVRKMGSADIAITEVSPEIYEILDTTGFVELFKVKKRMRRINVDGLEVIGKGFYGTVYRLDPDTIVKVYDSPDAISMIENEKKMAKMAFLKGVPTAISYDIVRVGNSYGSVFELLNAKTFNDLLIEDPGKIDDIVGQYVELIKQVHDTQAEPGVLPSARDVFLTTVEGLREYLPQDVFVKARDLISGIEDDNHLIHGDIQMKNVMLADGEPMLIDMDTLSMGQPIFDLQGLYVTYRAFEEDDPTNSMDFLGISNEMCENIWRKTLSLYFGTEDEESLKRIEDKICVLAYVRFLSIITGTDLKNSELGKVRIKHSVEHLTELVSRVDDLKIS